MMKVLLLVVQIGFVGFSAQAESAKPAAACFQNAVEAARKFGAELYAQNEILTENCKFIRRKKAVSCEVRAFKGEGGAASDQYEVVLTNDCSKVMRLTLTGEE